jgi:hypothetical protein
MSATWRYSTGFSGRLTSKNTYENKSAYLQQIPPKIEERIKPCTLLRTRLTMSSKFATREYRKQLVERLSRRNLRVDNKNSRNINKKGMCYKRHQ